MKEKDKLLLKLEIVIGFLSIITLLLSETIAVILEIDEAFKTIFMIFGFVAFIIGITYCIIIEQVAGYYKCKKCNHKYVPTFNKILWAPHIGRTRFMKCPKCKKNSWNKKVLNK